MPHLAWASAVTAVLLLLSALRAEPLPVPSVASAKAMRDQGQRAEKRKQPESVELYYKAAVLAYAVLTAEGSGADAQKQATELYNVALEGCFRTARKYGGLDPQKGLLRPGASGAEVPVQDEGFVW